MQIRQGDVWIESVDSAPEGAVPETPVGDRLVLAYGEATGHHHAVPLADAALLARGAERFLRVRAPTRISHEEHDQIQLPAGDYRVTIQREYDSSMISRLVVD